MPTTLVNLNGIMINEVHANPFGPTQDLNSDFTTNSQDSFIELYNTYLVGGGLAGWELWIDGSLVQTFTLAFSVLYAEVWKFGFDGSR